MLARLYADDSLYEGGVPAALRLPTFTGNHDFGRFAYLVRQARPTARDEEILQRVLLSNAMLFLLRGVPVVYYGDEQGFIGHGIDQAARQDMFPSQVASYNDQVLLGTASTTAQANFDALHPIYRQIAALATWRKQYPALRRGQQMVRAQSKAAGLFAASRMGSDGREILLAFNTSNVRDHRPGGDRSEHTLIHFTARRMPGAQCSRQREDSASSLSDSRPAWSRRLEARTGGLRRVPVFRRSGGCAATALHRRSHWCAHPTGRST